MSEPKRIGEVIPAVLPRMNIQSRKPEPVSIPRMDARSEAILKIIVYTEHATQIALTEEQRAALVTELVTSDYHVHELRAAAIILAQGMVKLFGRIGMDAWHDAVKVAQDNIGRISKFFTNGFHAGAQQVWREIEKGLHDKRLEEIGYGKGHQLRD